MTILPTRALPVKKTVSKRARSSAAQFSAPPSVQATYSSPKVSAISPRRAAAVRGVRSDGQSTAQLPAAIAAASGSSNSCTG